MTENSISTVCCFCHTNCGIIADVKDGKLTGIRPDTEHPYSKGHICSKALASMELINSPDRLQHPQRKTGSGFERISWDEAIDTMAERLLDIQAKYGGHTLVKCGGAPTKWVTWEAFTHFMAAFGSRNTTGASHLCSVPRTIGSTLIYGARPEADYKNSQCAVLWGANPGESRRITEGGVTCGNARNVIPEVKNRGGKLIVVDPRGIKYSDVADLWLRPMPGTDAALALAIIHTLIKEKLYDEAFVAEWTLGFDALAEYVKAFSPEKAEGITTVPADDIRKAASIYAANGPATIHIGNFVDQCTNTVQTVRAIGSIIALCGNLDVPGGNVIYPKALPPAHPAPPEAQKLSTEAYPLFPPVPFPAVADALLTGKPYKPRAMIVYHGNPALIDANSTRTQEALKQLDFLMVSDIFMSATAQLADIVLPDISVFEGYGLCAKVDADAVYIALENKVVEPVGESRPILEVEYQLAQKMGLNGGYPWTTTEECINNRLTSFGITLEDLKKQPLYHLPQPIKYQKYLEGGFNTPSKKIEFYSETLKTHGYAPLPEYREPPDMAADPLYPLIGTTRKPGTYTHTRYRNLPSLRKIEPEPLARIHPDDAGEKNIENGDRIQVESQTGSIEITARVTDETLPGLIIIDYGWGNPSDKKANVNLLTRDDIRDTITGTTPNRRFRCNMTKI